MASQIERWTRTASAQGERRPPVIVGLLGGIASGKSHVAGLLAARGAVVLDADRIAHAELARPDVAADVAAAIGLAAPPAGEALDRARVGTVVFGAPEKLRALEAILHPRVLARMAAEIQAQSRPAGEDRAVVVLDAPLLFEAGGGDLCDEVLLVDAPLEERLRRARGRGWAEGELQRREARQLPLEEKRRRATCVITNGAGLDALGEGVERAWRERIAPKTPGSM